MTAVLSVKRRRNEFTNFHKVNNITKADEDIIIDIYIGSQCGSCTPRQPLQVNRPALRG